MAQVLFQLLHSENPGCVLHVLAPAWSKALLSRMPEVTKSITAPFGHGQLALRERYRLAKQLRVERYDQAIVLPNSLKSALIPWLALIPKRTGWRGEYRFGLLNDMRRLDVKRYPQMVRRYATLAFTEKACMPDQLPNPVLQIQADQVCLALEKQVLERTEKPILALCPGAEFGPSKCWPAKHYAEVARQKLAEGWAVWIFGSPNDCSIAEEIQQATDHRCINLAGKTSLPEAIDLLSLAAMVVTNDSGLMHIAAALGRPVIALYGPTSSVFTPPLSEKAVILQQKLDCQPCRQRNCPLQHHNCMQLLMPKMVLNTIDSLHNSPE